MEVTQFLTSPSPPSLPPSLTSNLTRNADQLDSVPNPRVWQSDFPDTVSPQPTGSKPTVGIAKIKNFTVPYSKWCL